MPNVPTGGDHLSPVIQELLRRQQKAYATASLASDNFSKEATNTYQNNTATGINDVVLIGKKGVNGKPEINTIVETDKEGNISVQIIDTNGKLQDVTNQYATVIQATQKKAISDSSNELERDLVPANQSQIANDLGKRLPNTPISSVQKAADIDTAITDVLDEKSAKITFKDWEKQLQKVGLKAELKETGEHSNHYPKITIEISSTNDTTIKKDWKDLTPTTIDTIKEKVNLGAAYQQKFADEIVLAERKNLAEALKRSEKTGNKIEVIRDGERFHYKFQGEPSNADKAITDKLNEIQDSHHAIEIVRKYNSNIDQNNKGTAQITKENYQENIEKVIPLPAEIIQNQQSDKSKNNFVNRQGLHGQQEN